MVSPAHAITACLHLVPVSALGLAFSVFRKIWTTVQAAQSLKEKLVMLTGALAHLLQAINGEHRNGRLAGRNTAREIENLDRLLNDVSAFVKSRADAGFFKTVIRHKESIKDIRKFHERITFTLQAFYIGALLDIQDWQTRFEANLMELLNAQHSSVMAMVSPQDKKSISNSRERQSGVKRTFNHLVITLYRNFHSRKGHRSITTPRHQDRPKRPSTIEELSRRARGDPWDENKSFQQYDAMARSYSLIGDWLWEDGDLENAYVQFAKALAIAERLRRRPQYFRSQGPSKLTEQGVRGKLDEVTAIQLERLDKWNQTGKY